MEEQREFKRLDVHWFLSYQVIDDHAHLGDLVSMHTLNVSDEGICFVTTQELLPGTLIALRVQSDWLVSPFSVLARVRWYRSSKNEFTVGAEFMWAGTTEMEQAIVHHVQSERNLVSTDMASELSG